MEDEIDYLDSQVSFRANIEGSSLENIANRQIAEIEDNIKNELRKIEATRQIIEQFENETRELEASTHNTVLLYNSYYHYYEHLKRYYQSMVKEKIVLKSSSSAMLTTLNSIGEISIKNLRDQLKSYLSQCQTKWEECYTTYENLPLFQEVRQKQRTLIEVEVNLKTKQTQLDEIIQQLDLLKMRQKYGFKSLNDIIIKIAEIKCQTNEYELEIESVEQKIEDLKIAPKVSNISNGNDEEDKQLNTESEFRSAYAKIQEMCFPTETDLDMNYSTPSSEISHLAFPKLMPKVSDMLKNFELQQMQMRNPVLDTAESSPSLSSNPYIDDTAYMTSIAPILMRAGVDVNICPISEKFRTGETSQYFRGISSTALSNIGEINDNRSKAHIEQQAEEIDSVVSPEESEIQNSNAAPSSEINLVDLTQDSNQRTVRYDDETLQVRSQSLSSYFRHDDGVRDLRSEKNSAFSTSTTKTKTTSESVYFPTYSNTELADTQNYYFEAPDGSQNPTHKITSSTDSENLEVIKSNSLLPLTSSFEEDKELSSPKMGQVSKSKSDEVLSKNIKMQTRNSDSSIFEPPTRKLWKTYDDDPTEISEGYQSNCTHKNNTETEFLEFQNFSIGARPTEDLINKGNTSHISHYESHVADIGKGSDFLLLQQSASRSSHSGNKIPAVPVKVDFSISDDTPYSSQEPDNFFSSHSFMGGPSVAQQQKPSFLPQEFILKSSFMRDRASSSSVFKRFGKSDDSPQKESTGVSSAFHFNF